MTRNPERTERRQPGESGPQVPPIVQALDTAFRYLRWLALLLAVLYLATGVTSIQPDEEAIVLTLGQVSRVKTSGLLIAWPYPIDEVVRVATREAKREEVKDLWHALPGAAKTGAIADPLSPEYVFADEYIPEKIDPSREGYCLTGDKDILQAYVAVKYRISDPVHYALGQAHPVDLLRNTTMAAVTHALGDLNVDDALRMRGVLSGRIQRLIQRRLDEVESGMHVEAVELVHLHPPRHVIKDFQEVTKAMIEAASRAKEAEREAVEEINRAKADAVIIVRDAEDDAHKLRQEAIGHAQAFRDLLAEYRKGPLVVATRLYRETIEQVLGAARVYAVSAVPGGRQTLAVDFDERPRKEEPEQ